MYQPFFREAVVVMEWRKHLSGHVSEWWNENKIQWYTYLFRSIIPK